MLPLVEGGKGISVSNGETRAPGRPAGGVGTFSRRQRRQLRRERRPIPQIYHGRTRRERHEELVAYADRRRASTQARVAYEPRGKGRIHVNILWEMGAAERILHRACWKAKGLINGITCGAGMPYQLVRDRRAFGVHYYPIVSSARAFRALWKRAYHKSANARRRGLRGSVARRRP